MLCNKSFQNLVVYNSKHLLFLLIHLQLGENGSSSGCNLVGHGSRFWNPWTRLYISWGPGRRDRCYLKYVLFMVIIREQSVLTASVSYIALVKVSHMTKTNQWSRGVYSPRQVEGRVSEYFLSNNPNL